jgi:hypothetical protein
VGQELGGSDPVGSAQVDSVPVGSEPVGSAPVDSAQAGLELEGPEPEGPELEGSGSAVEWLVVKLLLCRLVLRHEECPRDRLRSVYRLLGPACLRLDHLEFHLRDQEFLLLGRLYHPGSGSCLLCLPYRRSTRTQVCPRQQFGGQRLLSKLAHVLPMRNRVLADPKMAKCPLKKCCSRHSFQGTRLRTVQRTSSQDQNRLLLELSP